MTIDADVKEIKELLVALNMKLDLLLEHQETLSIMTLAEKSLRESFKREPNLYSIEDLKVRYH
ncbi:MAG: hypothetical protein ACE5R6_02035 [Candidatus Heimdallarchaeota archaeon]